MKEKILFALQIIAGLLLVTFGSNIFFHFMPLPEHNIALGTYLGALFATGYIFPIAGIVYIISGISFLSNKFVPLAAILLMPVILNAFLAHLFLDLNGIGASILIILLTISIMVRKKAAYAMLFKA